MDARRDPLRDWCEGQVRTQPDGTWLVRPPDTGEVYALSDEATKDRYATILARHARLLMAQYSLMSCDTGIVLGAILAKAATGVRLAVGLLTLGATAALLQFAATRSRAWLVEWIKNAGIRGPLPSGPVELTAEPVPYQLRPGWMLALEFAGPGAALSGFAFRVTADALGGAGMLALAWDGMLLATVLVVAVLAVRKWWRSNAAAA
jgi:hypothetical protein